MSPQNAAPTNESARRVLILSVTQGAGSGAEAALRRVLGRLARDSGVGLPTVVSPRGSSLETYCRDSGTPWAPWAAPRDGFLQNLQAFANTWRERHRLRADCWFAWGARAFDWTVLLAIATRTPSIGRLADHPHAVFHGRTRQRLLRWAAHRMGQCVVPSQALAEACRHAGWSVPLPVIYNAFDPMPPRHPSSGLPVEVGFLGGFVGWKGIEVIARWVDALPDVPIRWQLFGDLSGPGESWRQHFRQFPESRVQLHPRRPPAEIYPHLDIVAHPSQHFDPSPNVLMEAASAGVPVVASDAGGSAEFVEDGRTGHVFPMQSVDQGAAQLRALALDTPRRLQMARDAQAFFVRFAATHDCAAAYRSLLAPGAVR